MTKNDKSNDKAKKPESQEPKSKLKINDDDRGGEEKPRTWSRFALASRLCDLDRG